MTERNKVMIYDVTLRDGWQDPRKELPISLKHRVFNIVQEFRPDYIELCWPSSSPRELEFAKDMTAKSSDSSSRLAVFGSTAHPMSLVSEDRNMHDLIESGTDAVTIFGKTWEPHVTSGLGITLEENLALIERSVRHLKEQGKEVIYDAEHFFSGWMHDPEYADACLKAAVRGGASTVVLCDTIGVATPKDIRDVISGIDLPEYIVPGIHAHNDRGLAVANTIEFTENALERYSSVHLQGTLAGMGERCGNADLLEIVPIVDRCLGYSSGRDLSGMKMIGRRLADITGLQIPENKPFIGRYAFANKAGAHVDAERKGATYMHEEPTVYGNVSVVVSGNQSGKANIMAWLEDFGLPQVDKNDRRVAMLLNDIKQMTDAGYELNGSIAERKLLIAKHLYPDIPQIMDIDYYRTTGWRNFKKKSKKNLAKTELTGRLYHDGSYHDFEEIATSENGPVSSQMNALVKVLGSYYPEVNSVSLVDYKPRIALERGVESTMLVPVILKNNNETWSTNGVSDSILEASLEALHKGLMYRIIKERYWDDFKGENSYQKDIQLSPNLQYASITDR